MLTMRAKSGAGNIMERIACSGEPRCARSLFGALRLLARRGEPVLPPPGSTNEPNNEVNNAGPDATRRPSLPIANVTSPLVVQPHSHRLRSQGNAAQDGQARANINLGREPIEGAAHELEGRSIPALKNINPHALPKVRHLQGMGSALQICCALGHVELLEYLLEEIAGTRMSHLDGRFQMSGQHWLPTAMRLPFEHIMPCKQPFDYAIAFDRENVFRRLLAHMRPPWNERAESVEVVRPTFEASPLCSASAPTGIETPGGFGVGPRAAPGRWAQGVPGGTGSGSTGGQSAYSLIISVRLLMRWLDCCALYGAVNCAQAIIEYCNSLVLDGVHLLPACSQRFFLLAAYNGPNMLETCKTLHVPISTFNLWEGMHLNIRHELPVYMPAMRANLDYLMQRVLTHEPSNEHTCEASPRKKARLEPDARGPNTRSRARNYNTRGSEHVHNKEANELQQRSEEEQRVLTVDISLTVWFRMYYASSEQESNRAAAIYEQFPRLKTLHSFPPSSPAATRSTCVTRAGPEMAFEKYSASETQPEHAGAPDATSSNQPDDSNREIAGSTYPGGDSAKGNEQQSNTRACLLRWLEDLLTFDREHSKMRLAVQLPTGEHAGCPFVFFLFVLCFKYFLHERDRTDANDDDGSLDAALLDVFVRQMSHLSASLRRVIQQLLFGTLEPFRCHERDNYNIVYKMGLVRIVMERFKRSTLHVPPSLPGFWKCCVQAYRRAIKEGTPREWEKVQSVSRDGPLLFDIQSPPKPIQEVSSFLYHLDAVSWSGHLPLYSPEHVPFW